MYGLIVYLKKMYIVSLFTLLVFDKNGNFFLLSFQYQNYNLV